ncbi:MAG: M23 family metallopeptidase [candidate division NC10 bacterium]|nr:M23 family metallopeptidase [candidate division NC10 bacterium]
MALVVLLLGVGLVQAAILQVNIEPKEVRQGDLMLLQVEGVEGVSLIDGRFGERPLQFFPLPGGGFGALVGIDFEEPPGSRSFAIEVVDPFGRRAEVRGEVEVKGLEFPIQRLTVPKAMAEPDQETLRRIEREIETLKALWAMTTPGRHWQEPFLFPVDGGAEPLGFGVRRIINGEERSRHSGVDIAAPSGTQVFASNAGRVALVGEYFFPGRFVILDHGLGLYTMYFHLQAIMVEEGQLVHKGQPIGTVGATGRATGPHLHFAARFNGSRVDPISLLKLSPSREPPASPAP